MQQLERVVKAGGIEVSSSGRISIPAPHRIIARQGDTFKVHFYSQGKTHLVTLATPFHKDAVQIAQLGAETWKDMTNASNND